mmetsp:Transcript_61503/g.168920  ORF Transcript_61503/g.168920 Transcript_61503/m.168920 type:complete len:230 (-) Transcript_61503:639-1328(-)
MLRFYDRALILTCEGLFRSGSRGCPSEWSARLYVFLQSMAIVMGPTPPGTGVMYEHFGAHSSKFTSPFITYFFIFPLFVFSLGSLFSTRLIPTSITTAPGLIQSPRTYSALPTAAIMMSAFRHCEVLGRVGGVSVAAEHRRLATRPPDILAPTRHTHLLGCIFRAGVAACDGAVHRLQQRADRHADDVRPPKHHAVLPADRDVVPLQQLNAAGRSARDGQWRVATLRRR